MERFCRRHDGKISGGGTQSYGYIVETEHYRYCLRCCPSSGSSSADLICYALDVQRQNMAEEKPPVGRVTCKAVDDIAYDFCGKENSQALEDYEPQQDMTLGGM